MPETLSSARCPDAFVALAERLATAAGEAALSHFRKPLEVERKADESPVTIADREAETAMRTLIAESYPGHGVIGEEHGSEHAGAEYVWVLDPIDGTKRFISGHVQFGALVALLRNGAPSRGVVALPALGDRRVCPAGRPS